MSLTNAEASAVNTLIERLTGRSSCPRASGREMPSDEDLVAAAQLLAGKAHRQLGVGFSAEYAVQAVREMLTDKPAVDMAVAAWQLAAAYAIVDQRLDRGELVFDGAEWAAEALDGSGHLADEVLLTHQSGRQITVRVAVELVEGALT